MAKTSFARRIGAALVATTLSLSVVAPVAHASESNPTNNTMGPGGIDVRPLDDRTVYNEDGTATVTFELRYVNVGSSNHEESTQGYGFLYPDFATDLEFRITGMLDDNGVAKDVNVPLTWVENNFTLEEIILLNEGPQWDPETGLVPADIKAEYERLQERERELLNQVKLPLDADSIDQDSYPAILPAAPGGSFKIAPSNTEAYQAYVETLRAQTEGSDAHKAYQSEYYAAVLPGLQDPIRVEVTMTIPADKIAEATEQYGELYVATRLRALWKCNSEGFVGHFAQGCQSLMDFGWDAGFPDHRSDEGFIGYTEIRAEDFDEAGLRVNPGVCSATISAAKWEEIGRTADSGQVGFYKKEFRLAENPDLSYTGVDLNTGMCDQAVVAVGSEDKDEQSIPDNGTDGDGSSADVDITSSSNNVINAISSNNVTVEGKEDKGSTELSDRCVASIAGATVPLGILALVGVASQLRFPGFEAANAELARMGRQMSRELGSSGTSPNPEVQRLQRLAAGMGADLSQLGGAVGAVVGVGVLAALTAWLYSVCKPSAQDEAPADESEATETETGTETDTEVEPTN